MFVLSPTRYMSSDSSPLFSPKSEYKMQSEKNPDQYLDIDLQKAEEAS